MQFKATKERIRRVFPPFRGLRKAKGHLRHFRRAQKEDRSFAGEYAHLRKLTEKLGIDGGFVVDIGASDGLTHSCTSGFLRDAAWSGLAIDSYAPAFSLLAFIFTEYDDVQLALSRVTPLNIGPLLAGHDVPKNIDLLNLDIDSYDLSVMSAVLEADYRPKVMSMEIAETVPPPIYYSADFPSEGQRPGDGLMGCSLSASLEVVRPYGYRLESLQFNNAIFVREDVAGNVIEDKSAIDEYEIGFRSHPGREELFPWATETVNRLRCPVDEAMDIIRKDYAPKHAPYTLRLAKEVQ